MANHAPIIQKPNITTININTGDDMKILCHCDKCKPLTAFSWTFENNHNELTTINDELNKTYVTEQHANPNHFDFYLELKNVTEENEGRYICHLENEFGSDELLLDVNILMPPKIENMIVQNVSRDDVDNAVLAGSSVFIKCEIKGSPIAIMQWTKDGKQILYDQRM